MGKRLPIDPLYRVRARPLKMRESRRIKRHALQAFTRSTLYPLDAFEVERQRRQHLFLLDMAIYTVFGIIALCLILAALQVW